MSEQKHTPGPWKATESEIMHGSWDIWSNGSGPFAIINGTEYADHNHQTDNAEANARLIAAAPDLLAACRAAAASYHHPACKCKGEYAGNPELYCTCHVQKARAAIAKAEGKAV